MSFLRGVFSRSHHSSPSSAQPEVFYRRHPLLASAQQVPASAFLQSRPPGLEKLAFWVEQHASAVDFLYFHSFVHPRRTPTLTSLRDSALKSQIITGLELIAHQEAAFAGASPSPFTKNGFPFPSVADLREVRSMWLDVCRNDFFCHELKQMMDEFVRETISHLKSITTAIVSLLAARDGVPENYVPVVQYQSLDLNPEMAANHDVRCRILRSSSRARRSTSRWPTSRRCSATSGPSTRPR
jgi:hypothetical protein